MSADHSESLAMVRLLGRVAGVRNATPTAATALSRALIGAFEDHADAISPALRVAILAILMEGYVAGREEVFERRLDEASIASAESVEIAEGVIALVLSGNPSVEALSEIVEGFGRALFKRDAPVGIVHLAELANPTPQRAAEVFAAHATARMVGAETLFVGATEPWRSAAQTARIDLSIVQLVPTFDQALERALSRTDRVVRSTRWLPRPLRGLFRRRMQSR